ncbi:hypothetical protein AKJ64_01065, partial [candidate division MSBL1 archaeon SCGC-AAA259E17]
MGFPGRTPSRANLTSNRWTPSLIQSRLNSRVEKPVTRAGGSVAGSEPRKSSNSRDTHQNVVIRGTNLAENEVEKSIPEINEKIEA